MDSLRQPPTPPAPSQRERRKQALRERIIEAAIDLFERQGVDITSIEDICALAATSRPTFYSYYASKQELVNALADRLWLNLAGELTRLSLDDQRSTREYLRDFFTMTREQLSRYTRLEKDLIRLAMATPPGDSNSIQLLAGMTALFDAVYRQGRKRKDIGDRFPIDFMAEMTMGAISSVMMQWATVADYPIDKRLRQLPEYLISMLELGKP